MHEANSKAVGQEGLAVVRRWSGAFPESDVQGIAELFASDATFFGTNSKRLVTDPEGIKAYYERALLQNRPRGAELLEHSVVVLSSTVVLVTGLDLVTGVNNGQPYKSYGRVSFILSPKEGEWKIVHLHRSLLPE